jgi:hypothetical protein
MPNPSEDEIQELVERLANIEAGFLPFELFLQIARLATLSIYETAMLRASAGHVQVLLLQRPANDKFWPDQYHSAGTVIRPTDQGPGFADAIARIAQELAGTKFSAPVFVTSRLYQTKRGKECALIHWAEVLEEPKAGRFFDIADLPDSLIEQQVDFIQLAVQNYMESKK